MPEDELLVENLPVYINLSEFGTHLARDWSSVIGHAKVSRTPEGQNKIEILLDENSSQRLGNMVEIFDLKAIGFAGIKRRPQERGGTMSKNFVFEQTRQVVISGDNVDDAKAVAKLAFEGKAAPDRMGDPIPGNSSRAVTTPNVISMQEIKES